MSKHAFALLLAALVGCKYAALPSLSNHDDASSVTSDGKPDGAVVDADHPDGATPDSPPDAAVCPSTSVCVEAPMAGWNGPAIFYEADPSATPPACSGAYDVTALALDGGLNGGNATCTCSCGAPTGTSCGTAKLTAYGSSLCPPINPGSSQTLSPGTCTAFTIGGASYYYLAVPDVTGGSCAASLAKNIPTPTWTSQFRACTGSTAFTTAGCSGDQMCAPRPSAPFDSQICIYAAGAVACPSGSSYSNRIVRYASYTDTRACSSCSCGAPSGSCAGEVTLTEGPTSPSCGNILDANVSQGCHAETTGNAVNAIYEPAPAATCTASTGMVTGSLNPTQPTTFCCLTPS